MIAPYTVSDSAREASYLKMTPERNVTMPIPPPGDERRRQVLAGLVLPKEDASPSLCAEVLVRAARDTLVPFLDPAVTSWETSWFYSTDDLRRPPRRGPSKVDVETALDAFQAATVDQPNLMTQGDRSGGVLQSLYCRGIRPDRDRPDPETYWHDVAELHPDLRYGTLAISVPQALLQHHNGAPVATAMAAWINHTAVQYGALTGYVTLDEYALAANASSLWETAVGAMPAERDFTKTLWGYGWGTLLRPAHLAAFGGISRLRSLLTVTAPGGTITENPDRSVWLQLGEDIRTTTWQDIATTRGLILPALPTGSRTVERYYHPEPGDTLHPSPYRL